MAAIELGDVELWGGSVHPWLSAVAEQRGVDLFQQCAGDLGQRLYHAFNDALTRSENVVVIGTDCPYLTPDIIEQAFHSLDTHDAVIGPAEDGGYVLLGLKNSQLSLFEHIQWGTDQVLKQTVMRIHAASLSLTHLAPMSDIDRPEDFLRLEALMPGLVKGVKASE
jgi:rSAM/selenodomain-associated transferase 1